jgi:hypothetical protein
MPFDRSQSSQYRNAKGRFFVTSAICAAGGGRGEGTWADDAKDWVSSEEQARSETIVQDQTPRNANA